MKIKTLNLDNLSVSEQDLNIVAENLQENHDLVTSVIKWQLANRRGVSSANTKTRGEISASGKKPFKQKHTGSARQGSKKGAQWVGGAKAFGPKTRDFSYEIPKKMVKRALSIVLKDKIANGKFYIVEGLDKLPITTNELSKKFEKNGIVKTLVAIEDNAAEGFVKSVRNIKDVKLLKAKALNIYDILKYDFLLLDKNSFETIKEVL
ncbi:MAG: 50S ribosomal protein L4 [Rickettsiales bacterium]|jgi:large subunit ribosomal protein L4|nr:50S ribosomal protein L4 [Rickettsiales bacterium]